MDGPLRRSDPAHAELRASDADRERVATLLRDNYSDGRLTLDEFQERLEMAYAAKTFGDLDTLITDLPSSRGGAAPAPSPAGPDAAVRLRRTRDRVLSYVLLMLFLIAIWAVTGRHGSFWPIWPIVIGAFILAMNLLGLQHPGRSRRRIERHQRQAQRMDRRVNRRYGERDDRE